MSKRLPVALRDALAQLQAGADPADVAASLIMRRAEAMAFRAQLPPQDPRHKHLDALKQAIGARTFDDSALSLEECLMDS